ncbi:hypothetical protein SAMN05421678_108245 [Actinopolymorpha cephalotaxi]|uniref:Uncharacterized protein n=1 Tax=Actinopolymorpha cephalotaxi TaxID=504797 RepID=A0A1I2UQ51_9ACTN|nr:hypothetical protein [Actinopolymorpha cephalotaxi]NYH86659.1 hypothetical protein [Actinopolymorpha cephalotaxi]SFG78399.1 hypothetical protein SAMN05421678_108245 [Actinopolymorpha cephalotaxi]
MTGTWAIVPGDGDPSSEHEEPDRAPCWTCGGERWLLTNPANEDKPKRCPWCGAV